LALKRETYGFQGFCSTSRDRIQTHRYIWRRNAGHVSNAPGDLRLLGDDHVYCGEATQLETIEKVMDGGLADMISCDPPYGLAYAASASWKPAELSESICQ
jgi:hypothetical protein